MTSIKIPLSAIGNHLNLNGISESIRSQSILTRFSNLKPLSEFFDFRRLSKPANFGEVQSRVNYNLGYFSSNYVALAFMLGIYSLFSSSLLLFDLLFVSVGLWVIKKLNGRDLELGFARLTTSQLYTGLFVIGVPIFILAGPFAIMFWLIGAVGVTILGHATFMDKPIESAFSEEVV